MNKLKLPGEVTFMPINRLFSKDISYPETQVCATILAINQKMLNFFTE